MFFQMNLSLSKIWQYNIIILRQLLQEEVQVKRLHPIIFVSSIFPNSHSIQKCIQNQQTAVDFVYSFVSNENWEKYSHKDDTMIDELPLIPELFS